MSRSSGSSRKRRIRLEMEASTEMTGRSRAGWWAMLPLLPWLALACRTGAERPASAGAGGLTEGPTRWLMLPEEIHQAERLSSTREAVSFIEAFWRRRDPDP